MVNLRFGLWRIGLLIEIDHDLRAVLRLPRLIGAQEFVFGARAGAFYRCPKTLPEDPNEDIAVLDVEDGVDQALGPFGMKAGIGIRFPASELKP